MGADAKESGGTVLEKSPLKDQKDPTVKKKNREKQGKTDEGAESFERKGPPGFTQEE